MSGKGKQFTPRKRLDNLVEELLAQQEAKVARGENLTHSELNGARRLILAQEQEDELARANDLARGR